MSNSLLVCALYLIIKVYVSWVPTTARASLLPSSIFDYILLLPLLHPLLFFLALIERKKNQAASMNQTRRLKKGTKQTTDVVSRCVCDRAWNELLPEKNLLISYRVLSLHYASGWRYRLLRLQVHFTPCLKLLFFFIWYFRTKTRKLFSLQQNTLIWIEVSYSPIMWKLIVRYNYFLLVAHQSLLLF